jgi:hypothetical protein
MKGTERKKRKGGSYKNAFSFDFQVNLVVRNKQQQQQSSKKFRGS